MKWEDLDEIRGSFREKVNHLGSACVKKGKEFTWWTGQLRQNGIG